MIIKAKQDKNKVLKGVQYETDYISYGSMRVMSSDGTYLGYYKKEDFTLPSGAEIKTDRYDVRQSMSSITADQLKVGDIVVCNTNRNYKYLVKGGKYRISEVEVINKGNRWSSGFVRFEGYKRKLKWSPWNFRKLTTQESRDLAINQIFDKEENFSVEFIRKFEQAHNKEKELFEAISKSAMDKNRHQLSIIEWAVRKTSKHMDLKLDDFDDILDMKLSEILEMID
jgi:hypothetical protein